MLFVLLRTAVEEHRRSRRLDLYGRHRSAMLLSWGTKDWETLKDVYFKCSMSRDE